MIHLLSDNNTTSNSHESLKYKFFDTLIQIILNSDKFDFFQSLYTVKSNYAKLHWNLRATGLQLYSLYLLLLVIDFPDQYKTFHCKTTNKRVFATNDIIITIIHWKIPINLLINYLLTVMNKT